ncbi:MAG: hypothetical protein KGR98_12715, partial [Verrucomicrobia bacterium]|nr:hypothetical protein [Verrucomicrobiota bacterium]
MSDEKKGSAGVPPAGSGVAPEPSGLRHDIENGTPEAFAPPNTSEEELLPDERPRRSRHGEADAASMAWEKSNLQPQAPFQLQPSTAADAPTRRRSRGKQGRDPLCSKYRMAWVLVFFDL